MPSLFAASEIVFASSAPEDKRTTAPHRINGSLNVSTFTIEFPGLLIEALEVRRNSGETEAPR